MAVLERSELEASPLADLHAIADQLGLDGFRRLRKADLIDAILGERADALETAPRTDRHAARRLRAATLREDARRADGGPSGARPRQTARAAALVGRGARGARRAAAGQPTAAAEPAPARARPVERRGEAAAARCAAARIADGRRRAARQRLGLPARRPAGALRRGRLHLRGPGPPLRARLRRPRHGPGAHAAPLRALPVAGPHRHDQRRALPTTVSGGPRYEDLPVAWPSERLALGLPGPHARGDRVADAARPRLARGDRRARARRQDRDPAAGWPSVLAAARTSR